LKTCAKFNVRLEKQEQPNLRINLETTTELVKQPLILDAYDRGSLQNSLFTEKNGNNTVKALNHVPTLVLSGGFHG
jgi:hypothetical protein